VEATTTVCSQCGYTSRRSEDFHDLLLNVTEMTGLAASLADYTKAEALEGGDQYFCETCDKKVDATRSARFQSLPPILSIGLNRFTYDMTRYARVKVTTAFGFPTELDMAPFLETQAGSVGSRAGAQGAAQRSHAMEGTQGGAGAHGDAPGDATGAST